MTMTAHDRVPLVGPRDDGIRPAGEPDACFYCHRKVGREHCRECVCLSARVRYRVTANLPGGLVRHGSWDTYDPWAWFQGGDSGDQKLDRLAGDWEFARNQGSWCADNAEGIVWWEQDTEELLNRAIEANDDSCSCSFLSFGLDEVVDNRFHTAAPQDGDAA